MKPMLPLMVVGILMFTACKKNDPGKNYASGCYHTETTANDYKPDAFQLLAREIRKDSTNHPNYDDPILNNTDVKKILHSLQAIVDLPSAESKLVLDQLNIHTFPRVATRSLILQLDTTAPEVQALINGQPTGDAILDSILNTYSIQLSHDFNYPPFDWIVMSSAYDLNLLPILEALEKLPYISSAVENFAIGDGMDISMDKTGGITTFTFSLGWGDCPAGCIKRHYWVFEVDYLCRASFVKEYGDPIELF